MSYGIFMIEETDKTLLFVPLRGLIMELKKGEKEIIMDLMNKPSFSFEKLLTLFPTIDQSQLLQVNLNDHVFGIDENEEYNFRPESLVLFTTFNCNLCCTYCYSKAGERKIDMDWQTAKTAIDFVI